MSLYVRIYDDFMDIYHSICRGDLDIPDSEEHWNRWRLICILYFEYEFEIFKFYTERDALPYVENNFAIWCWRNKTDIYEKWLMSEKKIHSQNR